MITLVKALIWAGVILLVAFVMQANGVSDGTSAGVVLAIVGAATGTMMSNQSCKKGCAT